jgi:cobalt-zinc-cadmium efflux system membrane fusion protein
MRTLLLVSAIAIAAVGCSGHAASRSSTEPPPGEVWLTPQQVTDAHLELETVEDRPVGGIVRAAGRVTFDDLRVGHVFSPVTGRITKIVAQPGQRVKKGQPLTVIQSPDLGSAISDMAKAQATLVQTEKEWKRQKELYEVQATSQSVYEAAESAFANAKAELERAQRKVRLLRGAGVQGVTQEYLLPAPIDGEVIARAANLGLEVAGQYSSGANVELFTIGELDRVWVLADVFEMDLPKIKQGAQVNIRVLAYPDDRFTGHVEWISGALDAVSRTAKVRCSIANVKQPGSGDEEAWKLRPEMFGTALITVNADTKLAIKRSAMLLLGEQPVVFAQIGTTPRGELRFQRRPVAVDEMEGGDYVPLKSGAARGEKVVVAGGVLLLGML